MTIIGPFSVFFVSVADRIVAKCRVGLAALDPIRTRKKLFGAMERITQLEEENTQLREENIQLREENARLQQQLAAARKNSSTSSKPPSSNIVKLPKPPRKDRKKRKRDGQPGHDQHLRSPFPPEAVIGRAFVQVNGRRHYLGKKISGAKVIKSGDNGSVFRMGERSG